MAEFAGIKQEDKQKLERAARMYSNATGEDVTGVVGSIPVYNPEEDQKAKAKAAEEQLTRQAETQSALEKSQQEARRLRARTNEQGEVQPENPGPGQPAMVTERAKAQGADRKGEEPATAKPTK
jgi:hypothetical protein